MSAASVLHFISANNLRTTRAAGATNCATILCGSLTGQIPDEIAADLNLDSIAVKGIGIVWN